MSRLVVFGSSFTYGHGLADCITENGQAGSLPSKLGWVNLLGDTLGLLPINNSFPGASNLHILNTILEFKFDETDTVIIQWAMHNRELIFNRAGNINVGHWADKNLIKNYYAAHSNYDMAVRSMLYSHHANCHVKLNKVRNVVNFTVTNGFPCFLEEVGTIPEWYNVKTDNFSFQDLVIDKALDDIHPGPNSQMVIANQIKELI